ncbi:glycine betaine ABC transporter substrate-binding protein [Stackebrandtia nassauensis]|uniref:Substrate-binding region of ABC-type glycine betaine transport system n=1 Tax=Stackebrandtia nassauensis (strain DSM 44728 / CIP 108903 / NRRL B-16338 / NBRC 102104 / LLR-40K-21) TaxID=446470 RepID=D3QA34_STANL|nr:glycine betaine ABC transporter substrate-binding protein [Stackebrandtia nassauensis]ADD40746.1 Substrate-binding region of ABC-type glycine betaine transport system [Stackebrandtia nassauensis DSM 44728]
MSPHKITRIVALPAAVAVLALGLAACGSPGSSGTKDADKVSGKGCEPVAGDSLVALEDDKKLQASENILAAFNDKAADEQAIAAVNAVSAKLTTDDLIELNKSVDVDRKSAAKTAKAFAEKNKLTKGLDKGSGSLVVGHANYTESEIVANLYAIALEGAGYTTELKDVGNRETYLPALEDNDFQVIPEYAASLTETLNPDPDADSAKNPIADNDIDKTLDTLKPFAKDAGLALSEPAEAASQNAYVVTKAFAKEHGVKTLSDFADKCSGKASSLAGPPECPKRLYCEVGLKETYGIQFGTFNSLDLGTGTKQSVASGDSTVGTVTTTDSALADGVTVKG